MLGLALLLHSRQLDLAGLWKFEICLRVSLRIAALDAEPLAGILLHAMKYFW